jgi:hypothetical protein
MPDVLARRQLNRALLDRQLLLQRVEMPAAEAIEHLVGLQAQEPKDPYLGLWTRLHGFRPGDLASLISERQAVRMSLYRGTIHLVTARDAVRLRPVVKPVLDRLFYSGSPFGRRVANVNLDDVLAGATALIAEQPCTGAQVRRFIAERWPDGDAEALAAAVNYLVPLVQIPPRGLWDKSGQATRALLESWLGQPVSVDSSPQEMILRYLRAFGPATVMDIQAWSGLTRVREAVEPLRPQLRAFRDEKGRELLDLPDGLLPDPDTPAPPRFLPVYDNVFLGHADRARIVSEDERRRAFMGMTMGNITTVLIDGFVRANWKLDREGENATLRITPIASLSKQEIIDLEAEGSRLLAFLATDASSHNIEIREPA